MNVLISPFLLVALSLLSISVSARNYDYDVSENPEGSISSANYPGLYPIATSTDREDYHRWLITLPDPDSRVLLRFLDMKLGYYSSSYYDEISIYNGNSTASGSRLGGPYRQSAIPNQVFISSGNVMLVYFHIGTYGSTYDDPTRQGFLTSYESITSVEAYEGPSGNISSPNYPENYNPSELILSTITQDPASEFNLIRIEFEDIDTEECCDFVKVYDGPNIDSRLVGSYSGKVEGSNIPFFVTTGNSLTFLFNSDVALTGKGYSANYYPGIKHTLNGVSGGLTSTNYPGYPPMLTEQWLITVPNQYNLVFLSFKTMSTEQGVDVIRVYDGETQTAPLLGEFSGSTIGSPQFLSRSNTLLVQFTSDDSNAGGINYAGFAATYESVANTTTTTAPPTTSNAVNLGLD